MRDTDSFVQLAGDLFVFWVALIIVVLGVMAAFHLYDLVRDTFKRRP